MRISTITTRQGDQGKTILNGEKIPKTHPQVIALGDLDELNSLVGLLRTHVQHIVFLEKIQHALFSLGRDVALPEAKPIFPQDFVDVLEKETENLKKDQPDLKEFILPSGNKMSAMAHCCRSVCRRAERSLVAIEKPSIFLNRLSDYFFVLARHLNDSPEILWDKDFFINEK